MKNPDPRRGAFVKATDANGDPAQLNTYLTETWQPPRGCTAYDADGNVLSDQHALPEFGEAANRLCLESPMMGVQFNPSQDDPGEAGQLVNGNYGFATSVLNQWPVGNVNNPAPNHNLPMWADLAASGLRRAAAARGRLHRRRRHPRQPGRRRPDVRGDQ